MSSVLIAIPNTGNIRTELVEMLMQLKSEHDFKIMFSNRRPIDDNRNYIVNEFIKSGFDYLLMIDSDIVPTSNILDMINSDVDICSGMISINKGKEIIRLGLNKAKGGYKQINFKKGLNEVDVTGTGCMLINKRVFKELSQPYFEFQYENGLLKEGEDFNFCSKAKEKGFKIYYNTNFPCYHYQVYPII